MRSLTKLESEFLKRLKQAACSDLETGARLKGVFVTQSSSEEPALQVGLQLEGEASLVFFKILIYGTRPVRYHLEAEANELTTSCRPLWNRLLGAINLVVERSGEKGGRFHLFYEVSYPDKELKQLGEK